jgi:hypothetical protein
MQTDCISGQLEFEGFDGHKVVAGFDGGAITSDAGALLLRHVDGAISLFDRVAGCFIDGRNPDCTVHSLRTLIGQRIAAIALGYEDVDDHDTLRHDPVLALLSESLTPKREDCAPLAGKSTLNRLELGRVGEPTRYHKISYDKEAIEALFLEAHAKPPPRSFSIWMPPTIRCTATRRAASSTAITTATAICRSTSSAAGICWLQRCGAPTSTPARERSRRSSGSSPRSAGNGARCASSCAPTQALPARR